MSDADTAPSIGNDITLLVAQTNSSNTHQSNIDALEKLVEQAQAKQVDMLCLPEASGLMNQDAATAQLTICEEHLDPYLEACQSLARRFNIWIHNGSTPVLGPEGKPVNRTHLINNKGQVVARYDKIHLFDIYLADGKDRLESSRYSAGTQGVVVDTPWGRMGLTICYDLRFPKLYRDYAQAGARIVFAPSAFTRYTGRAHWEALLRARAVENACFMVAAAQTGEHDDNRKTYGHSMVVHPWGEVMLDAGDAVQAQVVSLNLAQADEMRRKIPSLNHSSEYRIRDYTYTQASRSLKL